MSPHDATLARLLQDLQLPSDELRRALSDSTALFARLRAHAQSLARDLDAPPPAPFTAERVHRELSELILRELARLCDLAADRGCGDSRARLARNDLRELLEEELDGAESLEVAPPYMISALRALAIRLPQGVAPHAAFAACARSLRDLHR